MELGSMLAKNNQTEDLRKVCSIVFYCFSAFYNFSLEHPNFR